MKTLRQGQGGAGGAGFTLLECLLALFVFSVAVVALVEAIHQGGEASIEARRRQEVVSHLDSLVLEITRNPPKELASPLPGPFEVKSRDNGVDYRLAFQSLELRDADDAPLPGLFSLNASARWLDGTRPQSLEATTWLFPPLFVATQ